MMASFANLYRANLRESRFRFELTDGVHAFPNCDSAGEVPCYVNNDLPKKFVIIQHFGDEDYLCSCQPRRGCRKCLHITYCREFMSQHEIDHEQPLDQDDVFTLDQSDGLCAGVYSHDKSSFGIIKIVNNKLKCLTEGCATHTCDHVRAYKDKMNITYNHVNTSFPSVSKLTIRYPHSPESVRKQDEYDNGSPFPQMLIPVYNRSNKCIHGSRYSRNEKKASPKSYIHTHYKTTEVEVYYRPSKGSCSCKQEYEGDEDLLFNYNNVHIFTHRWLFTIMHANIELKYPLDGCIRLANLDRGHERKALLTKKMYDNLRCAYNAFLRRLDVTSNPDSIRCLQCPEDGPDVLHLDGTAIGCQKDRMAKNEDIPNNSDPIPECRIQYRVLLRPRVRKLLASYVGEEEREHERVPLPDREFQRLLCELPSSLSKLIEEAGHFCPDAFLKLLRELCTPYSTCGIFQFGGEESKVAQEILHEIGRGDFRRLESDLEQLDIYAPLFVDFVQSEDVPQYLISDVISDILDSIYGPSRIPEPDPASYGRCATPAEVPLHYYPNNPCYLGLGNYAADKTRRNQDERSRCKKITRKHQNLSPGIFTFLCNHGVCHGFTLMDKPESPKTAFDILVTRFKKLPSIIMYDAACQLHLYAIKREPAKFKDTKFLIDKFHARNHTCTKGFHTKTYKDDRRIQKLNTSIVEQFNSRLRNLANQIASMPSDNAIVHIAMFIALKNLEINSEYIAKTQ